MVGTRGADVPTTVQRTPDWQRRMIEALTIMDDHGYGRWWATPVFPRKWQDFLELRGSLLTTGFLLVESSWFDVRFVPNAAESAWAEYFVDHVEKDPAWCDALGEYDEAMLAAWPAPLLLKVLVDLGSAACRRLYTIQTRACAQLTLCYS